jgi:hypothetical protein
VHIEFLKTQSQNIFLVIFQSKFQIVIMKANYLKIIEMGLKHKKN